MSKLILQLKTPLKRTDSSAIRYIAGEVAVLDEGYAINLQLPGMENPSVCFFRNEDVAMVVLLTEEDDLSPLGSNDDFMLAAVI